MTDTIIEKPAITMRPYQAEAVASVMGEFRRVKSTIMVLPTGAGKTATAGELIRKGYNAGRSILWIAHRHELITQAAEAIERASGCTVQVEMAERSEASGGAASLFDRSEGKGRVVVASVMSLVRRLHKFPSGAFDLVIVDECHRGAAASYVKILEHFASAKRLGLTATPERGDKKSLTKIFETVAFDFSLFDAIHEGWLVPIRRVVIEMNIDLSGVHTRAGDFAANELSAVMTGLDALRDASVAIVRHLQSRQALVFCVDVAHVVLQTESLREVMRELGVVGRVEMVHGETPPDVREEIFSAFRRGEIVALSNCEIATEGTDLPTCSLVALLRPTKSRTLFCQMRGRGVRALPGVVDGPRTAEARRAAIAASDKPDVLVLDLAGNFDRHAEDVIDSLDGLLEDDDPDAAEVRRIMARGDTDDLMKAIEMARAARFGRERARLAKDGDLFALFGLVRETDRWGRPMTDKQRKTMTRVLVTPRTKGDPCVGIDRRGANQAITEMVRRTSQRLCTYKQAWVLAQRGVPLEIVERFTFDAATSAITTLAKANWRVGTGAWWRDAVVRAGNAGAQATVATAR